MYRIKNGRFQLFKPKCRCGSDMSLLARRAIGGIDGSTPAAVMSNVTMGPQVIWTKITFQCTKHPELTADIPASDLIKMAGFTENQVDFINLPTEGALNVKES